MFKIIGLFMIILSSFTAAIYNMRKQKQKLLVNEAMLDFIMYINHRIIFFREQLDVIYTSYENKTLEKMGFLTALPEVGFSEAVKSERIDRFWDQKAKNALMEFGKRLGKSSLENQKANCNMCIEILEEEVERISIEMPQKSRVYSSLCIIIGLGVALLLI